MSVSIRLTAKEKELANSYAMRHAISLRDAFKRALFEKIENEYDIALTNEAYSNYIQSGRKSRPIDDLWKELDL